MPVECGWGSLPRGVAGTGTALSYGFCSQLESGAAHALMAARGEHCPAPWGLLWQVGLDRLMFFSISPRLFYTAPVSSVSSPLVSAPGATICLAQCCLWMPPFALPSAILARRYGEEQAWPNHCVGTCCLGCERSCLLPAMGAALCFSPQQGRGKKLPQVSWSKAKSRGCFKL